MNATRPPSPSLPEAALQPAAVARTVRRSRIAEAVAFVTVISAMTGACASAAASIVHDTSAVRIAEAKARECRP